MPATLERETYLPPVVAPTQADGPAPLTRIHDFLEKHDEHQRAVPGDVQYFIGSNDPSDRVELPEDVYRALRKVVDAMRDGLAVTVVPSSQTLTTQQAADLLGVSRPTVVKLLEQGRLQFERIGTHRRLFLRDLLEYRQQRRREQYAALDAMAVDFSKDDDLETSLAAAREARNVVAARHHKKGEL